MMDSGVCGFGQGSNRSGQRPMASGPWVISLDRESFVSPAAIFFARGVIFFKKRVLPPKSPLHSTPGSQSREQNMGDKDGRSVMEQEANFEGAAAPPGVILEKNQRANTKFTPVLLVAILTAAAACKRFELPTVMSAFKSKQRCEEMLTALKASYPTLKYEMLHDKLKAIVAAALTVFDLSLKEGFDASKLDLDHHGLFKVEKKSLPHTKAGLDDLDAKVMSMLLAIGAEVKRDVHGNVEEMIESELVAQRKLQKALKGSELGLEGKRVIGLSAVAASTDGSKGKRAPVSRSDDRGGGAAWLNVSGASAAKRLKVTENASALAIEELRKVAADDPAMATKEAYGAAMEALIQFTPNGNNNNNNSSSSSSSSGGGNRSVDNDDVDDDDGDDVGRQCGHCGRLNGSSRKTCYLCAMKM